MSNVKNLLEYFSACDGKPGCKEEIAKLMDAVFNGTTTKRDLDLILEFLGKHPTNIQLELSWDVFSEILVKTLSVYNIPEEPKLIMSFLDDVLSYILKFLQIAIGERKSVAQLKTLINYWIQAVSNPTICHHPSPAVGLLLAVIPEDYMYQVVDSAVSQIDKEASFRTAFFLCKWLVILSTKTKAIGRWLGYMIYSLHQSNKWETLVYVAEEVLESLLTLLVIPLLREEISRIVFIALVAANTDPKIYALALRRLPSLALQLFKQNLESSKIEARKLAILYQYMTLIRTGAPDNANLKLVCQELDQSGALIIDILDSQNSLTIHEEPDVENRPTRTARVGLINTNNTCFMNSVLQALFMVKRFCDKILCQDINVNAPAIYYVQYLFALMRNGEKPSLATEVVLDYTRPAYFNVGLQQDSYEYLLALLDVLDRDEKLINGSQTKEEMAHDLSESRDVWTKSTLDELGTSKQKVSQTIQIGIPNTGQPEDGLCSEMVQGEDLLNSVECENSNNNCEVLPKYLRDIFLYTICSTYKCTKCETESSNSCSCTTMPLCFPANFDRNKVISVQELVDLHFQSEFLRGENSYKCDTCGSFQEGIKSLKITQLPGHLIIVLQVFAHDSTKFGIVKLFPKIDCSKTITISVPDKLESVMEFSLCSVVAHLGDSINLGHYVTYSRDETNTWFYFNDQQTTSVSYEDFNCNQNAIPYILIYQKASEDFQLGVQRALLTDLKPGLAHFVRHTNARYKKELRTQPKNAESSFNKDDKFDPSSNCGAGGGMGIGHTSNPCVF